MMRYILLLTVLLLTACVAPPPAPPSATAFDGLCGFRLTQQTEALVVFRVRCERIQEEPRR